MEQVDLNKRTINIRKIADCQMPGAEKGQMIMKAGIYHSSARAMNGEVEVELEVSERRIENLRVIRSHETPGIGTPLYDKDHRRMDRIGVREMDLPESI